MVKSLLGLICHSETSHFIIIDGIDECGRAEVRKIVNFWVSTVEACDRYSPGKVRVLFVSEDTHESRKLMRSRNIGDLSLDEEQMGKDIQRYVTKEVGNMRRRFDLTEDQFLVIRDTVCRRSEGTILPYILYILSNHISGVNKLLGVFLYSALLVRNLLAQVTTRDLMDELGVQSTPSTLGHMYVCRFRFSAGHTLT